MLEIVAAAKAAGYQLPPDIVQKKILNDPIDVEVRPSMMQDVSKGNFIEIENIVHQPLLEGTSRGVPMPTLKTVYYILKGFQRKTMEKRGLWEPAFTPDNPYR
jgi:ketopantoate reductase